MKLKLGIDRLLNEEQNLIINKRIGLVSNASGVTSDLINTVDALQALPNVKVTALFAPEHGFQSAIAAGDEVNTMQDPRTGLPVYSLYGPTQKPTAEMLANLDLLVFDIQTVGVRFFTYITTLLYVMEAAAEQGLPVIVCDRPNPIGGEIIEGPLLNSAFRSFVGPGPLPIRHGLTIGELALLYQKEWGIASDLTVVQCEGWQRSMWFDDTDLSWVPPSPNVPKLDSAIVYPGTCLIEGTNLSEGRGTTTPLEIVGAPWVDAYTLADALNGQQLAGVYFRPVWFRPVSHKWAGETCQGVQLHVRNRADFRPVPATLELISVVRQHWPREFSWREAHFDRLAGGDQVRAQIEAQSPVAMMVAGWQPDLAGFASQCERVRLYR